MARGKKTNLDYNNEFTVTGTIQKTETFQSKGGGLNVKLQIGDKLDAEKLIMAEGCVCEVTFRVSQIKADAEDEEENSLEFDDTEGDGE